MMPYAQALRGQFVPQAPQVPQAPSVGAQPIDPQIMERIAAGQQAAGNIARLQRGSEMADALRRSQAELPGIQGRGFATTAANPLNALTALLLRRQGRKDLQNIDTQIEEQAKAQQSGQMAQLEMQQAMQDRGFAQNRLMAEEQRQAKLGQVRENFETWVDDKGNQINVATTYGGKAIDSEGNEHDLNKFKRMIDPRTGAKTFAHMQKRTVPAIEGVIRTDRVLDAAEKLTDEDVKALNAAGKFMATQQFSPEVLKQYIRENAMNLSDEAKNYLALVADVSAIKRHGLSGSALTKMEKMLSDDYLPSATGLSFDTRVQRLFNIRRGYRDTLKAVDMELGGDRYSSMFSDRKFNRLGDQQQAPANAEEIKETIIVSPEGVETTFNYSGYTDQQRKDDMEYYQLTGKHLPIQRGSVKEEKEKFVPPSANIKPSAQKSALMQKREAELARRKKEREDRREERKLKKAMEREEKEKERQRRYKEFKERTQFTTVPR